MDVRIGTSWRKKRLGSARHPRFWAKTTYERLLSPQRPCENDSGHTGWAAILGFPVV